MTRYSEAKTEIEREQLAHQIARLCLDGVPWDGVGGIVAMGYVSGATQGRELLRKFCLTADTGGPVVIRESYDREAAGLKGRRRP
jgi:hypothetical protein